MACTRQKSIALGDFAAGRLGIKETEALLEHLESCAACSAEFDDIADLVGAMDRTASTGTVSTGIGSTGTSKAISGDAIIDRDIDETNETRRIPWNAIRVAAAGILICFAAWWFAPEFGGGKSRLGRLAVIDPIPAVSIRLRSEEIKALPLAFTSAMEQYARQEYDKAVPLFAQVLEEKPDHLPSALYLGICRLQSGDLRNAKPVFEQAASRGSGLLKERSLWYLGNTCLKLDEKEEALRWFKELEALGGDFELNAKDMILKIQEIR